MVLIDSSAKNSLGKIEALGFVIEVTASFVLSKLKCIWAKSSEPEMKCILTFTVKLCPTVVLVLAGLNTTYTDCAFELRAINNSIAKEKNTFLFTHIRACLTGFFKFVYIFMFPFFNIF